MHAIALFFVRLTSSWISRMPSVRRSGWKKIARNSKHQNNILKACIHVSIIRYWICEISIGWEVAEKNVKSLQELSWFELSWVDSDNRDNFMRCLMTLLLHQQSSQTVKSQFYWIAALFWRSECLYQVITKGLKVKIPHVRDLCLAGELSEPLDDCDCHSFTFTKHTESNNVSQMS